MHFVLIPLIYQICIPSEALPVPSLVAYVAPEYFVVVNNNQMIVEVINGPANKRSCAGQLHFLGKPRGGSIASIAHSFVNI